VKFVGLLAFFFEFEKAAEIAKRGLPGNEIAKVMRALAQGETLEPKYKAHRLVGNWIPCSECHIRPDWL